MKESTRNIVIGFIDNKNIQKDNILEVLEKTKIIPTSSLWYNFIDQILLWFGALSLAFAVLFFIAYNWVEFGHFAKFALVEGLMFFSVMAYWYLGAEKLSAKVMLMVSSILLGVLLALVGQTYQTGADPWQLFFYWAVLMLPWAFVGRFGAMWIFWIALINISILLYMNTFGRLFGFYLYSESSLVWIFFAFNSLSLFVWESLTGYFKWLNNSWAIRLLGFVSMVSITWLVQIFIWEKETPLALLAWIGWLLVVYAVYRVKSIDLFMLSLASLSFSIGVVTFFINLISWRNFELLSILFIGMVIIGLGAGCASWLKSVQKEAHNESE